MTLLARAFRRLRVLLRRRTVEREMNDEMRFHLEMDVAERVAAGATPEQARREALLAFGGVERWKEEGRDARGVRPLQDMGQDFRYAVRVLAKTPVFTAVAIATIALGIGATTAIFSALEAIVLRPLPWRESDRLVVPLTMRRATGETWNVTWADLADWQQAGIYEHVAVFRGTTVNITGDGDPERLAGAQVTDEFFDVLGMTAALGRFFRADEYDPSAPLTAVISHSLWQRRFGGEPGVIGRTVRVGGNQAEIVGVMPQELRYPRNADVWFPLRVFPEMRAEFSERDNFIFQGIARLAPGKSLESVRAELDIIARRIEAEAPSERLGVGLTAVALSDEMVGDNTALTLWILLGAVGFILLIACVNVANLLLSRATVRRREFALRAALGAGRLRLVRQYLAESLVLGLTGGAIGIGLAHWGTRALVALAPRNTPRVENIELNPTVLALALVLSVLCALLFGLAPALQSTSGKPLAALGEGDGRTTGGLWTRRGRAALLVGELALSLILLTGAGLLLRSLSHLHDAEPGFEPGGLISFQLSLQGERHPRETRVATYEDILRRMRAIPGVENAGAVTSLPLLGGGFYLGRAFLPEGRAEPPAGEEVQGMWNVVTPGYFETMRIPVIQGRGFTERDEADAAPVMVVSRAFARAMFPDGQALGKRVRSWRDENVYREIVGITDDIRHMNVSDEIRPVVYVPHRQDPWSGMVVVLRAARGDPAALMNAAREAVRAVDPDLPLAQVRTLEEAMASSLAPRRFAATLLAGFAALALALTTIGIYGVLAYSVAQRTREVGIRMALGARPRDVVRLIVGEATGVVAIGTVIGLLAAFVLTRTMQALLFGVTPTDPATFVAVTLLLFTVAILASMIPARRATLVAPVEAMRPE